MEERYFQRTGEVKVEMDSGTKSEGEEDSQAFLGEKKANLGRTPNHLTLSTTSTISAGSTGSQARLIQSSHQPENYQPIAVKELGKKFIFNRISILILNERSLITLYGLLYCTCIHVYTILCIYYYISVLNIIC